jgi:hypothetical protein
MLALSGDGDELTSGGEGGMTFGGRDSMHIDIAVSSNNTAVINGGERPITDSSTSTPIMSDPGMVDNVIVADHPRVAADDSTNKSIISGFHHHPLMQETLQKAIIITSTWKREIPTTQQHLVVVPMKARYRQK